MTYAATLAWPAAGAIAVLSPQLTRWWLDRSFADLVPAAVAAMALVVVVTPASGALYVISGAGRVRDVVGAQVRAAPVNVALSLVLLPVLGVGAVFVGTLVSSALVVHRYLEVAADVADVTPLSLVHALVRPLGLATASTAVLALAQASPLDDVGLVAVGVACALAVGVAAIAWVVPRRDLRHVFG
jgi:O-antigen/teichoic acid export membrane protein